MISGCNARCLTLIFLHLALPPRPLLRPPISLILASSLQPHRGHRRWLRFRRPALALIAALSYPSDRSVPLSLLLLPPSDPPAPFPLCGASSRLQRMLARAATDLAPPNEMCQGLAIRCATHALLRTHTHHRALCSIFPPRGVSSRLLHGAPASPGGKRRYLTVPPSAGCPPRNRNHRLSRERSVPRNGIWKKEARKFRPRLQNLSSRKDIRVGAASENVTSLINRLIATICKDKNIYVHERNCQNLIDIQSNSFDKFIIIRQYDTKNSFGV